MDDKEGRRMNQGAERSDEDTMQPLSREEAEEMAAALLAQLTESGLQKEAELQQLRTEYEELTAYRDFLLDESEAAPLPSKLQ